MSTNRGNWIVDAQVHLNHLLPNWKEQPFDTTLDAALLQMDQLNIEKLVIGEVYGLDDSYRQIGFIQENNARRVSTEFARYAIEKYPLRFCFYALIDPQDMYLDQYCYELSQIENFVGLRAIPLIENGDVELLRNHKFDRLFEAAEKWDFPIFIWVPSRASMLIPYLEKYPNVKVVIDHIGVGAAPLRNGAELPTTTASSLTANLNDRVAEFHEICKMSRYPNLYIKWSHAPMLLTESEYPYTDLYGHLRLAINSFGIERIMWASDITVASLENGNTWYECIHYLMDSEQFTIEEKQWLFQKSFAKLHENG